MRHIPAHTGALATVEPKHPRGGKSGAAFYIYLATVGAALSIATTFSAIIAQWLGLLDK